MLQHLYLLATGLSAGLKLPLLLLVLTAAISQGTTAQAEYVKSRKKNNDAARAEAYCTMVARGSRQGFIAIGDPNFVGGAALGNGIGNLILQAKTKKDCMTALGYEWVPSKSTKKPLKRNQSDRYKP